MPILLVLAVFGASHLFAPRFATAQADTSPGQTRPGCPTAPASRLHVGGEGEEAFVAVVAPGLGPLNMRALPAVSTGVEVQLYSGNRVSVIGGPSCNGGYTWWRVETANGRRGWIAEGNWERYFLLPEREYTRVTENPNARPITPVEATCPPWRPRVCVVE